MVQRCFFGIEILFNLCKNFNEIYPLCLIFEYTDSYFFTGKYELKCVFL